jgi:hypothetical protein
MRKIMTLAAIAAFFIVPAAYAQESTPPAAPEAPAGAPTIQSVSIVDITELPEATQTQVNELEAQRGEEDLVKLRSSIDAMPEIKAALEAKGLSSAEVIAASLSDSGELMLVTRKEAG